MAVLYAEAGYYEDKYVTESIYVDWANKEIFVPVTELTSIQTVPFPVYELNLDTFHEILRDLEDGEEGIIFDFTHDYVGTKVVGGTTLAPVVEIVNGYTVTFEDGQYAVNLPGANSNVADVRNINQVSVRPQNSAGLVVVGESGLSAGEQTKLDEIHRIQGLDTSNPVSITDTSRSSGDISQTINDDGTTTTVTRTP